MGDWLEWEAELLEGQEEGGDKRETAGGRGERGTEIEQVMLGTYKVLKPISSLDLALANQLFSETYPVTL